MKNAILTDWKVEVKNLPDKAFRESYFNSQHYIKETDNEKYGFLFYNVAEFRMGWYAGAIAILTNKKNPITIFDSKEFHFRYTLDTDFIFFEQSEKSQLTRDCFIKDDYSLSDHTFCLLDINKKIFAIISFEGSDYYSVKEIDDNKFTFHLNYPDYLKKFEEREKKILKSFSNEIVEYSNLLWYSIEQLIQYNDIYWRNRDRIRLK